MPRYHFEDFAPGWTRTGRARSPPRRSSRSRANGIRRTYHTDEEKARESPYAGLIASGWQTAGVAMRLMCDGYLLETSCVGSPGIDELRFLKPVRPGDALRFRSTVLETAASKTRPNRGTVTFRWEVINQHGEVALSMIGRQLFLRRPGA